MAKDKVWYRQNWQEFEVVTDSDKNPALGIEGIILEKPTPLQYQKGIVCHVDLQMTYMDIRCQVLEDEDDGSLALVPPYYIEERPEGNIHHNLVTIDKVVVAQVLRHVEAKTEIVK